MSAIVKRPALEQAHVPALLALDMAGLPKPPELQILADAYRRADPFAHIVLDGLFPTELLRTVAREISEDEVSPEKNVYGSFLKRRNSDIAALPPTTRRLVQDLNSPAFIEFLEALTGVENLIPDPHLEGGGVHQIGAGGYLKVHTDFNWHARLKLHRRLNILLYLNEGWNDAWNGQLELWDSQMSACRQKISPIFNRLVVFSTTDGSFHGHPEPLSCPADITRNSIALYYYTTERPTDEVRFGASTRTNYRERPDERFENGRIKHRLHQILIRNPWLRRLIGR